MLVQYVIGQRLSDDDLAAYVSTLLPDSIFLLFEFSAFILQVCCCCHHCFIAERGGITSNVMQSKAELEHCTGQPG